MKVINVSLVVKPQLKAEYEEFIADLVRNSAQETGNLYYGHFKKLDSDNEYEIIEHWRDQAAVEAHNATPHFQKFLAGVNDYLVKEPEITRLILE
ncbi:MAG: putative quinol monooxygenase [Liquorilactobacillus ghanensis]|nr:putative quinol monooxygenase [Liquorilactobacillus ghanensis]